MKKVVVIGGGTGSSVVLTGLKNSSNIDLTSLAVVTDSGGSTGRLRDEFGFLPVGDLRQCLMALADGDTQDDIRDLLLYRFTKGNGLQGHNLGNIILTALEDIKDSPGKDMEAASKIFRVKGKVFPITEVDAHLMITYEDGQQLIGEHFLDDHSKGGKKITNLQLSKPAPLYKNAKKAILEADTIVVGPGDLYGSLLPHSLVKNFKQTFKKSTAKFVYVVNLMTHFSQTHDLTAQDHVDLIEKYFGKYPDVIIINSGKIPPTLLKTYEDQKEFPVIDDLEKKAKIIRSDMISKVVAQQNNNDKIKRSLLRHDSEKLANILKKI